MLSMTESELGFVRPLGVFLLTTLWMCLWAANDADTAWSYLIGFLERHYCACFS